MRKFIAVLTILLAFVSFTFAESIHDPPDKSPLVFVTTAAQQVIATDAQVQASPQVPNLYRQELFLCRYKQSVHTVANTNRHAGKLHTDGNIRYLENSHKMKYKLFSFPLARKSAYRYNAAKDDY